MKLKWYGQAAFRIIGEDGTTIITDPYTPELLGYPPIPDPAHIVIVSSADDQAHCRHDLIAGGPTVINALEVAKEGGSRTTGDIMVRAVEAMEFEDHPLHAPGQNGMYRFEVDGIQIAHMGDVGNSLNQKQTAFFEDVDILLALTGGELTIKLDDLKALIDAVQPKLIVPMHFRTLTYKPRNTHWIESFLAYFNEKQIDFAFGFEVEISSKDIPESTRVLVMDYAR